MVAMITRHWHSNILRQEYLYISHTNSGYGLVVEPPGTAQGARDIAMNTIDTVLALMKPEISRGRNQQIFT